MAIKSIPHCQWSWSILNLNEEMLVVLLLVWDLYTPGAMDAIYCALCHTVQTVGELIFFWTQRVYCIALRE